MTKAEYIGALRNKLDSFNQELQQEILEDYEQHFAEGLAAGKTEEEIIEELGAIEDMIRELPEEDIKQEIQIPEELSEEYAKQENGLSGAMAEKTSVYEGDYKAVVIEGLLADVSLKESADGRILVDYRNEDSAYMQQRYRFYQYDEDGVFHVGIKDNGEFGSLGGRKKIMLFGKTILSYNVFSESGTIELEVAVPAGIPRVEAVTSSGSITVNGVSARQLHVQTDSGELTVSDSAGEELKLETGSGEVQLSGLKGRTIQLQGGSGDIGGHGIESESLEAGAASGSLEFRSLKGQNICFHTVSGDIEGHGIRTESLDAGTASGDLEMADLCGRTVRLHTASGDIEGKNIMSGELSAGTGSGDVTLSGNAEEYVVKTGSGDVELRTEGEVKRVQIETGSGDVELDLTGTAAEAEIQATTGSGECVVYGANGRRYEVSFGSCIVGSGDCKVNVSTGSGDAEIRCKA